MNKSFIDCICNGEVLTSIRYVHLLMGGFELLQTLNKFNFNRNKSTKTKTYPFGGVVSGNFKFL